VTTGAHSTRSVRIRRVIAATPEQVYAAWLDPSSLARWLSPVGHAEAEIEPRVGGRLAVTMVGDGRRIEHTGEYRELVPPRRLVFTWRSPYTGPSPSLVTVDLQATAGGTELTLVHEFLPEDAADSHGAGWGAILDRLAVELTRDHPGMDR
jgi:uncharacterized protein YndB with AHSA1/START domain